MSESDHIPAPAEHRPTLTAFVKSRDGRTSMVLSECETRKEAQATGKWLASDTPVEVRQ